MKQPEIKMQKLDKPVTNPKLVEAIGKMRKNFCHETQNIVLNIALRSTFLVPGTVAASEKLVADEDNHVHFDQDPQVKFLLINHSEKGTFIPAFTDDEQISTFKSDKPFQAFALSFVDLAAITENTPQINGFIVNPTGQNLPFTQALLDQMKKAIFTAKRKEAEEKAKAEK